MYDVKWLCHFDVVVVVVIAVVVVVSNEPRRFNMEFQVIYHLANLCDIVRAFRWKSNVLLRYGGLTFSLSLPFSIP